MNIRLSDFLYNDDIVKTNLEKSNDWIANIAYKVFSEDELLKNLEQIIFLLKNQGVDINVQNGNGETLLIQLAKQNSALYYPLSEILIKNGANIDIKDQYGKTAASYMLDFKNKSNKNKQIHPKKCP